MSCLWTVLIEAARNLCIVPRLKFKIELHNLGVGGRAAHGDVDISRIKPNDLVHNGCCQRRFHCASDVFGREDLNLQNIGSTSAASKQQSRYEEGSLKHGRSLRDWFWPIAEG